MADFKFKPGDIIRHNGKPAYTDLVISVFKHPELANFNTYTVYSFYSSVIVKLNQGYLENSSALLYSSEFP